MPLFEYVCGRCGKPSELLIRGQEKPKCPHCGCAQMEKQLSAFSAKGGKRGARGGHHCCGGCPHGGCH